MLTLPKFRRKVLNEHRVHFQKRGVELSMCSKVLLVLSDAMYQHQLGVVREGKIGQAPRWMCSLVQWWDESRRRFDVVEGNRYR